ncbi:MAG: phenylalanine--tRNA ligase subunit beta [Actinobacteria bacterium]|nr:phenylalanine--tRNA ligase subunit beta [Actinomycetota bacterium]
MKVTLNWLKEFVDFSLSATQVADALTMAGLEVEEVYTLERNFSRVVVGKIVKSQKHPDADHLSLCRVDIGGNILPIVCGAPNAYEGLKAPLALDGSVLLNDLKVETQKIRGFESQGMLCSEAELGLSERSEQLMELTADAEVGKELGQYLGEPDIVFDINVTPNRPDCLSVIGIAREIAAMTGSSLKKPELNITAIPDAIEKYMTVDIKDEERCFRYSGRYLRDITIKPAPFWMALRLHAVGIRSINNVVDVTNYVMMEVGQPLHAFDYRLLEGKKVIVRAAEAGERFTTLDGQEHELDQDSLLICDGVKPVALAGVMGGLNSEVQPDTNTVFLESAYFEPTNIRRTAKKLDLSTESSRRFERGIDPNGTIYAMNRAASLMVDLAGGHVVGDAIDNYPQKVTPVEIDLSVHQSNVWLGVSLKKEQIAEILSSIELSVEQKNGDTLRAIVPTFRPDLTRPIDLVEEIARLYGYDNIEPNVAPRIDQLQEANPRVLFRDFVRQTVSGMGFRETCNLSLIHKKFGHEFLPQKTGFVELLNPLSEDLGVFRPNMIVSLLTSVAYNRNRQMHDMRLFEIGNVAWKEDGRSVKTEKTQIAGILAGHRQENAWYGKAKEFDFYDIKGVVEGLLAKTGIEKFEQESAHDVFWDAESSKVIVDGKSCGAFGKITDDVLTLFKIKTNDLFAFYFDFDKLFENCRKEKIYNPVPRFPSVPFDLAILIDVNVSAGSLEKEIWKSGGENLVDVHLFDYYKGEQVEAGKKSVAFSLTFSSKERTLSDDEIENVIDQILAHLSGQFGAQLRDR